MGVDRATARSLALLVALVADGTLLRLHLFDRGGGTRAAPADPDRLRERLDPNSASEEELRLLHGIGPERARAIARHRRTRPFRGVADLLAVPGIGPRTLAAIRDDLRVGTEIDPRAGTGRIESGASASPPRPRPPSRGPP